MYELVQLAMNKHSSRADKRQGYNLQANQHGKSKNSGHGHHGSKVNKILSPPPKLGESEIKFIDGKKHYLCAKCSRSSESHGTDSHKTKENVERVPVKQFETPLLQTDRPLTQPRRCSRSYLFLIFTPFS